MKTGQVKTSDNREELSPMTVLKINQVFQFGRQMHAGPGRVWEEVVDV